MSSPLVQPPTEKFSFPWLDIQPEKIVALTQSLIGKVKYHMGAKVNPLSLQTGQFSLVDCSGFTRWNLYHALGQPAFFDFPDGSVNQRHWAEIQQFKESDIDSASLDDEAVRIAFLPPDSPLGPEQRHVMLVTGGLTCESHGHLTGVDRREWGSEDWMQYCKVYVLYPPKEYR